MGFTETPVTSLGAFFITRTKHQLPQPVFGGEGKEKLLNPLLNTHTGNPFYGEKKNPNKTPQAKCSTEQNKVDGGRKPRKLF